jgi:acetyl-CoA carboxylase biotin carboxyl carrier protein
MIDLEFVERLIRALDQSSLDTLEVDQDGTRVRLSKSPPGGGPRIPVAPSVANASPLPEVTGAQGAPPVSGTSREGSPPPVQEAEVEGAHLIQVTSPMVGTFYRAPAPDAAPYVEVGGRIGTGTVLCIIEAMKLMNELESEVEGTVAKIMVENAQPVEYGQVLFLIDPS